MDQESRAEGIGPRTFDLLKIVTCAQVALVSFARAAVRGSTAEGLLCPTHAIEPQDLGTGAPIPGPRTSDLGPLVLAV